MSEKKTIKTKKSDITKDYEDAIQYFIENNKQIPPDYFIYNMIGYLYKKNDGDENIEKQIKYFKKALELKPDYSLAIRNLAFAYYRNCNYKNSLKFYKKLLKNNPVADDYFAYACLKIQLGDFKEGWKYYEYRFLKTYGRTEYPQISKPRWEGQNLQGKVLLVHYEQGLGDSIAFFRYLKLLVPSAKKIIFKVQNELLELLKINSDAIEIVGNSTSADDLEFDYHIPIMSLPFVLKMQDIPLSEGYIEADRGKVNEYKKTFFNNDCFKIGISWHGAMIGNESRNIPLDKFFPLACLKNVKIYSFQKSSSKQLKQLPENIEIIDLGQTFNDFLDTASAMVNVDLFITSDNSILNLAGAMGKPACLLLNKNAEWRWMLDENITPWYNSVKIIKKQTKDESWNSLINKVLKIINEKMQ